MTRDEALQAAHAEWAEASSKVTELLIPRPTPLRTGDGPLQWERDALMRWRERRAAAAERLLTLRGHPKGLANRSR